MGCTTRRAAAAAAAALRLLRPDKVKEDAYTEVSHQLLLVSKQPLLNGAVTCWQQLLLQKNPMLLRFILTWWH